ncbi:LOW QUALITY PROTEIN: hypothetical protein DAPPUDRAFT_243576 [Daphnia pulex]|uniref:Uncharacterized protein n=1 Tax=Daphnia pulex TaxID=6669 RepID=E9GJ52_DAPPU|nr:LOW QUALITY PROTEIN: hypothetical protein DAPPUDRAFT_243576 [Daphnia pulex]|eukprot:EFX80545.1 LOW QUALITY PROTEIN: hypothetical protein DAPPUDRAFT_243576 [Daphnia pulex]
MHTLQVSLLFSKSARQTYFALSALILAVCVQPDNHPPINSANSNSNRNVTTNNNDDSLSQVFGNQNAEDPNQFPCPDGQPCARNKSLSTEGGESILAKSALETAEEGTEDMAVETISEITFSRTGKRWTIRRILKSKDVPKPVCGHVQKDVRGTFKNGLGKAGTEVVALLTKTSFSRNEKSRTLKTLGQARIDLQDTFDQFGKRWVCLYLTSGTVSILLRMLLAPFLSKPIQHSPLV